jgi:plasmid maintenance system antidote protein VapI
MMKQKQIAKILRVKESYVCMILNEDHGKNRPVSWPLAERLAELFPGRTIQQWKKAKPEELKRAFAQLKNEEVA